MPESRQISHSKISWVHYNQALTQAELEKLAEKYGFAKHHLDSATAGKSPRAKVASNKSYAYFVFHIPYLPQNSNKYFLSEINVFVTKTTLITIQSQGNSPHIAEYFEKTKSSSKLKETRMGKSAPNLFTRMMNTILNILDDEVDKQGEEIDGLSREVFDKKVAKQFIEKISLYRYNLTLNRSALEPQVQMLLPTKNGENPLKNLDKDITLSWTKMIDLFQDILHQVQNDSHHLEGMVKTFESLITFRTNEIIKILTIFSVSLMPINVISGIYGMNFRYMPLTLQPIGFFVTVTYMLSVATLLALLFRFKRWF